MFHDDGQTAQYTESGETGLSLWVDEYSDDEVLVTIGHGIQKSYGVVMPKNALFEIAEHFAVS